MKKLDRVILGVNHQFIYETAMTDADAHTHTLKMLSENENIDALDCWVWADHSKEELAILKGCVKQINYNIGDRFGEVAIFPATTDKREREYALDILKRETSFAVEAGSKKIVFGSGRDVPDGREDAKKRFEEFVLSWSEFIPKDICVTLEPTDRDVDKHFLYGSMTETREAICSLRSKGMKNIGILLDMAHIPIMHETLESAVLGGGDLLEHIHLGNCVIKDKGSRFYGDKHPSWGYIGGEYDENDGAKFIRLLRDSGYFTKGEERTVSFEMRPLVEKTPEESIEYLTKWFNGIYR